MATCWLLQLVASGVEAHLARARRDWHRCAALASVVASFTDARARHDKRPSLSRLRVGSDGGMVMWCDSVGIADGDVGCCKCCQLACRLARAVRGRPAIDAQS